MDRTVAAIIGALTAEKDAQLRGLGDFPKHEPFDHGVQIGVYRGLLITLDLIATVLNDQLEEDNRR